MDTTAMLDCAVEMFHAYDLERHLAVMTAYRNIGISESQFAQFLGRCRLYQYLPFSERKLLPEMLLTDTQVGAVARSYYEDRNFGRTDDPYISLWKVYNLLTGSNKISYIDNFLDRAQNATVVTSGLARAIHRDPEYSWFLG
jgi:hypothetical protein